MEEDNTNNNEAEATDNGISKDERQLAMLAHLLSLVGGFIAPLIIYLMKKDESEFIKDQAGESLNFQITMAIASFALVIFAIITCGYGAILFPLLIIADIVCCILAAIQSNDGNRYRYPVNIRLIK